MKKYLAFGCCICICFLLQVTKILAADEQMNVLTSDSILEQSEDENDIRALTSDIINFVNSSFEDEDIVVNTDNINFSKTYCVYVDVDIFEDTFLTYQQIDKLKQTAKKVWVVPIKANGNNIIVQISRALTLNDIQRQNITIEEKQEIEDNAGKWQVVSASIQDKYSDFNLQLNEILSAQNIDSNSTKCVLFGGIPGIQTVLAVLTDGESIIGLVSLQRDIQAESNENMRSFSQENKLAQDKIYSFESYSKIVDTLRTETDKVDTTSTSGFNNRKHQNDMLKYVVAFAILSTIILAFIVKKYKKIIH